MPEPTSDERVIELNKLFEKEMGEWEKLGVDPNTVINFNPFRVDSWIQGLTLFLIQEGIIEENKFIIFLKEKQIETLQEIRVQVEVSMRQARLQGMGIDLPNMAVPKGKLKKMH